MKKIIQAGLQRILGFQRYLFVFSLFKIYTLKWDGAGKEGDFNFFMTLLKPDDSVLDIGANIGIMTALLARKCHKGKVFAFEPVPENFQTLKNIVSFLKLPNVTPLQMALGEHTGQLKMGMPLIKGVKMQGLSHVIDQSIEGYESEYITYDVPVGVLDEMTFPPDLDIRGIKIDVENFEYFVLKGGEKLLARHLPIIYCELWDNENRQRCFQLVKGLGYEIFVLDKRQLIPYQAGLHPQHNFFFMPPASA